MKKKVIILGSTGMLGHQVYFKLKEDENLEIINISFRKKLVPDTLILDLNNLEALKMIIHTQKPSYIINCVGVLISGANKNPSNAIFLNSFLPHFLVGECDKIGAKLIHISTDCVFSGAKGNYKETDEKDGKDIYSKTKALGEIVDFPHVTLRTSIVGPELKENGEGLLHWFLHQKGEINGYTSAFWGGVTTYELAKCILRVISENLEGLFHVSNGKKISKFHLLLLFKDVFEKNDIKVKRYHGKEVDKSLCKSSRFNFGVPSYEEMIKEQKKWMENHRCIYLFYNFLF